jgi:hypothetical protein
MTRSELISAIAGRFPQFSNKDFEMSVRTILDHKAQSLGGQ